MSLNKCEPIITHPVRSFTDTPYIADISPMASLIAVIPEHVLTSFEANLLKKDDNAKECGLVEAGETSSR